MFTGGNIQSKQGREEGMVKAVTCECRDCHVDHLPHLKSVSACWRRRSYSQMIIHTNYPSLVLLSHVHRWKQAAYERRMGRRNIQLIICRSIYATTSIYHSPPTPNTHLLAPRKYETVIMSHLLHNRQRISTVLLQPLQRSLILFFNTPRKLPRLLRQV